MKKIKIIQGAFLTLVALGLGSLMYKLNTEPQTISKIDNRMLTDWGAEDETFTENVDDYLSDRIGFRSEAIDIYTELNDDVFGEMVHPQYTYGKDGYVFTKMDYERCDDTYIDLFCAYLKQVQNYCEERDVPFIYCLNPSKNTVYQEYLPTGYNYQDLVNTAMKQKLEEYGVNYITNEELLIEKHKTEQVYNVKYDAAHWNDLGAFYGTNHLLEKVAEYYPSVKQLELSDFEILDDEQYSLPVSKFNIDEVVPWFVNLKEDQVENHTEEYAALEMDENFCEKVVLVNTGEDEGKLATSDDSKDVTVDEIMEDDYVDDEAKAETEELPRVLMFQGSYYNENERYRLIETSFQEYYGIHNYENFINFDYYFNIFQPDVVILETAEYTINGNYFSWAGLETKTLNPVLDVAANEEKIQNLSDYDYEVETDGSLAKITISAEELEKKATVDATDSETEEQNNKETEDETSETVSNENSISRGWLVIGDKQFDFSVKEDGSVSCTVDVKNFEETSARVCFE